VTLTYGNNSDSDSDNGRNGGNNVMAITVQ